MRGLLWKKLAGLSRPVVIAFALAGVFGVIAVRGTAVALDSDRGAEAVRSAQTAEELPRRADIVDRNGELLATTVAVYSLYADPRAIWDAEEVTARLVTVFEDLNRESVIARLEQKDRKFVWVRRGLTPRQRQAVFDLGLEGLGFEVESKRIYPRGTQSGHVLGHTNVDGVGQKGIELSLEDQLQGREAPVMLTIDSGVQFVLEAELAEVAERHEVIGAVGLVIEASTGSIRALASWPAFNPNRPGVASDEEERNRAVEGVYELGSIFKPLTVAAALEAGKLDLDERFDVRAPIVLRGRVITDTHEAAPRMTAATILAESSNIGTVKIAQRLEDTGLQDFYQNLGLLARAKIELPASARALPPPEWTDLAIATASYGHGIAVSPLAFAATYTAFANKGAQAELRLVETDEPPVLRRVMSEATADAVLDMLRGAVLEGTGRRGEAPGYRVAGKTGTAEKPIAGGYAADRNVTSFAALFPANSPEYVVLIVLDDPRVLEGDGGATAAWNAAPVAGRVIERIAPILGVQPEFDQAAREGVSERSLP